MGVFWFTPPKTSVFPHDNDSGKICVYEREREAHFIDFFFFFFFFFVLFFFLDHLSLL